MSLFGLMLVAIVPQLILLVAAIYKGPRGILLGCLIGFLIPWLMVLVYLVEVEGHGKTPPTFRLSDIFGTPFVVGLSAVAKEADHAL